MPEDLTPPMSADPLERVRALRRAMVAMNEPVQAALQMLASSDELWKIKELRNVVSKALQEALDRLMKET